MPRARVLRLFQRVWAWESPWPPFPAFLSKSFLLSTWTSSFLHAEELKVLFHSCPAAAGGAGRWILCVWLCVWEGRFRCSSWFLLSLGPGPWWVWWNFSVGAELFLFTLLWQLEPPDCRNTSVTRSLVAALSQRCGAVPSALLLCQNPPPSLLWSPRGAWHWPCSDSPPCENPSVSVW